VNPVIACVPGTAAVPLPRATSAVVPLVKEVSVPYWKKTETAVPFGFTVALSVPPLGVALDAVAEITAGGW
jgi:hypothetical protein